MSIQADMQGIVGPIRRTAGNDGTVRIGVDSELISGFAHAKYYEPTSRGFRFSAANQAAQAVSVALTPTYTGLLLYNPVGSGKILVPGKIKFALSVAPVAIASIGLITGFSATGGVSLPTATRITPQNCALGNTSQGAGIAVSTATLTTPTWLAQLVDGFTAGALPAPSPVFDFDGSFVLLPGAFLGVGALTAVTGLGYIDWEEVNQ